RTRRVQSDRTFNELGRPAPDPRYARLHGNQWPYAENGRGLFPTQRTRPNQDQGCQRAGRTVRGHRIGSVADALAEGGRPRLDKVRRPRTRDGGAAACSRDGARGTWATRRRDGRAGGGQIAAVLRIQSAFTVWLDGARGILGFAR